MPDGHRGAYRATARDGIIAVVVLIVAIATGLFLWPTTPVFNAPVQLPQAQAGYQPGGQACSSHELARVAPAGERQVRADECADKWETHREAQQNAQETSRAAKATEQAAYQSYYQGRAAATAAALLILALGASAWAAVAAFDAARAAHLSVEKADETLRHARESSEKELRAYIVVHEPQFIRQNARGMKFEARPVLQNLGQTPAYRVFIIGHFEIIDYSHALNQDFSSVKPPNALTSTTIGPQKTKFIMSVLNRTCSREEIAEVTKGTGGKQFFAWGTVWYEDVFGASHQTSYCFHGIMPVSEKVTMIWNSFLRGNDAD